MAPPRPRQEVAGSTKAVNAVSALARLLARQAAREAVAALSKAAPSIEGATIATDTSTATCREAEHEHE